MTDDVLILGGGVIGLSLAYELSSSGLRVRVLDKSQPGREASWAGAGMLPPASLRSSDPRDKLFELSNRLHAEWSERLLAETGMPDGYRRCGGIYLSAQGESPLELTAYARSCSLTGIRSRLLTDRELADTESSLAPQPALLLPDESQVRNPRRLKALLAALAQRGAAVEGDVEVTGWRNAAGRVTAVETTAGPRVAGAYCVAAGAWSDQLLAPLGVRLRVKPIRGQIALLSCNRNFLTHDINIGPRYLVPRDDGRVLVGSTEEDVGFEKVNTESAIAELLELAYRLAPVLRSAKVERTWAGLRPAIARSEPCLGLAPELDNLFIAAGHFRNGLQLSTGTARVMTQLIRGETTEVDLEKFSVGSAASARELPT